MQSSECIEQFLNIYYFYFNQFNLKWIFVVLIQICKGIWLTIPKGKL